MQKVLFLRRFKKAPEGQIRTSGTHIKMKDYFLHCLHHRFLDPYLYFTPDSDYQAGDVWREIPRERIIDSFDLTQYDFLFLTGRDWKFLPKSLEDHQVINILQSLEQCEPEHPAFRYLKRPAYRICVSPAIEDAIAPHKNGISTVINYGIPLEIFAPSLEKIDGSVTIWGRKNQELAQKIHAELAANNVNANLLLDYMPREEFAETLAKTDILIALSQYPEGFYLPALEGMASGCAVVCADAVGNRGFCLHEQTCLMPIYGDCDGHVAMTMRLLYDEGLKSKIRAGGQRMAETFTVANERKNFYAFLEQNQMLQSQREPAALDLA